jgi:ribosomal protein L37AE/L43A
MDIREGRICPYCGGEPEFVDSDAVYSRSYGMIWLCQSCSAWVGVHKGTTKPLGRLADAFLRERKREAHHYFDNLWRQKMLINKVSKSIARNSAYAWLSKQIGLHPNQCHIGMMNEAECYAVITVCKPYFRLLDHID